MTSNHPIALLQDHWETLGGTFPALRRDDRRAYAGTKSGCARPNEQAPADRRVLRTRLCIARSIIVTMIKAGAFGYGASWRIARALKIPAEKAERLKLIKNRCLPQRGKNALARSSVGCFRRPEKKSTNGSAAADPYICRKVDCHPSAFSLPAIARQRLCRFYRLDGESLSFSLLSPQPTSLPNQGLFAESAPAIQRRGDPLFQLT